MEIGPVQLLAVGFERTDRFKGEILAELENLKSRGLIRVLDLLFVMKDESGDILALQDTDLSPEEEIEMGAIIGTMMGLGAGGEAAALTGAEAGALAVAEDQYGMTVEDIQDIADGLEPGTATGILLVEHVWAAAFKHAIRDAGGFPIAQGFITPEALLMVGAELQAIAEAEAAIEVADAIKGAAMLDALITVEEAELVKEAAIEDAAETIVAAEMVKTAAVAETVRTLVVAGLIQDAAVQEALDALAVAGLLADEALTQAEGAVAQAEAVAEAALAEAGEDDDEASGVGEAA
jgi:uncharacterized membrane protein